MKKVCPLGMVLAVGLAGSIDMGMSARAAETVKAAAVGTKVADGSTLRDLRGNRRALHSFANNKALVLCFLGTDCPVANLYLPGLLELEKQVRAKGVQFLAIYPNENEDLDRIGVHSYDAGIPFPVLKDFSQDLANQLGVTRVPTVVVLDGEFNLKYRGRVDDRYGVAYRKPQASRADLSEAISSVLASKPVQVAETEADGCLLDKGSKLTPRKDVTYAKHVAPIIQNRCQSCHRPEQTAPFALMTYEDVSRRGRMLKEVTMQKRMPPWHADPRFGKFHNDRRMTKDEIETLASWVDAGMPKGDDKDLPKPIDWPKGWALGKPDLIYTMPEEFEVPAEGSLPYQQFMIDTNFAEDRWVKAAECRPGSPSVVHHVVVYIHKDGQRQPFQPDGTLAVLVGWAPGDLGLVCPPDTALRLPKGCKLRMEMHYTPNGKATKDRSSIGITFAKEPPKNELFTNYFANEAILLPPHEQHYTAEATLKLRADARILSFIPHMHWRGKDYRYEIHYPDGKKETVLSVPRWDFNWQNIYYFEEPLKLPKGAKLYSVAHWDNSKNNPYNPAPDKSVRFGLQTWEEMMVGWVSYVYERPEDAAEIAKNPISPADALFDRLDKNGDDVITRDEVPDQLKPFLILNGLMKAEKMDRKEFTQVYEEMRKKMPQRRPQQIPEKKDKQD